MATHFFRRSGRPRLSAIDVSTLVCCHCSMARRQVAVEGTSQSIRKAFGSCQPLPTNLVIPSESGISSVVVFASWFIDLLFWPALRTEKSRRRAHWIQVVTTLSSFVPVLRH
ncbi:hypothetical protein LIA77_09599 [Sarocladium implicatum]|nr:hypothetical protein LIA77_09599 [Sarocladium implicatum]